MSTFIKKVILFALCIFICIELMCVIVLNTDLRFLTVSNAEIYVSIEKSKKKNKSRRVIIGDSVGNQLFPNDEDNGKSNSLACNQAIGVVGHYLLLNNYLNTGNSVDTVVMIYSPVSFQNNLDQKWTYNCFIKPFNNERYSEEFTSTVNKQIDRFPYEEFSQVPHILATAWAPNFDPEEERNYSFLSPISVEYLLMMKELSKKHNFKLMIVAPPIDKKLRAEIQAISKKEIRQNGLSDLFENYFDEILYLESSLFYDGVHLWEPEPYSKVLEKQIFNL